jgi:small subunit ribosomal protein S13e
VRLALPQVDELITKAAKKGQKPSQIGVMLRDQHGIPLVKSVTGSKILRILKAHGEDIRDHPPLSEIALCVLYG